MNQIKNLLPVSFILILLAGCASQKNTTDVREFVIRVERSGPEITLSCQYGCAWSELAFNSRENQQIVVHAYGLAPLGDARVPKFNSDALAPFLFTMERTDNGVFLRGNQGTSWQSLSLALSENESMAINHKGIIE